MKKYVTLLLVQLISLNIIASEITEKITKETHVYSVKGIDSLKLDRYYVKENICSNELKPSIIFMFGGAFYTGVRDNNYFIPCFEYYAKQGYNVFSIDYRLGLKNVKLESVKPISKFITLVDSTINIAVEDLYDATSYIVDKSKEWNLDSEMIVPFGSSAGAISVLQAEYYRVNNYPLAKKLPDNFQYGGIISMAGAIFSMDWKVSWDKKAAPILMFQGSADANVPYNKKSIFKFGFYGSKAIAKSLRKVKSPYYLFTFKGAGHEIASTPMNENREDINIFLTKLVKDKESIEITKTSVNSSKSKVKERFTMKDYLRNNFTPNK